MEKRHLGPVVIVSFLLIGLLLSVLRATPLAPRDSGANQACSTLAPSRAALHLPIEHASANLDEPSPLSTLEAAKRSSRIVLAKCLSKDVRKSTAGNIFTFWEFEILRVIKGKFASSRFTIRLIGGRIGNQEMDLPSFSVNSGDKVVLFLGPNSKVGYPTFFAEGVFKIAINPINRIEVITPLPRKLPLFYANSNSPYSGMPGLLPLEDFLFSLRKLN